MTGADEPTFRVSRVQRLAEERLFDPLFRRLLRSPLHWLASRWLVLVSYTGRRSGRRYTLPVAYARRGDAFVVVTPKSESVWWRNFTTPRRCTLRVRGRAVPVVGEVVDGDGRVSLLVAYRERHPLLGRLLDVPYVFSPG